MLLSGGGATPGTGAAIRAPVSFLIWHANVTVSLRLRRLRAVQELAQGLWWWTAPHPDWTPDQGGANGWQQEVSSYAFDCGDTFVLVDPQSPPSLLDELAAGREVAVALTCEWHRRSTDEVVERLGANAHDLPPCVEVKASIADDRVLFLPQYGAVVFGDTLLGEPDELRIPDAWLGEGETHEARAEALRPLLELRVEHALPTHGRPGTGADLERALA